MALSFASYTGDGSNKNFAVPFPYISSGHVSVFVDGVAATFVWLNAGLVQTSVAPVNGSYVLVRRQTPNETAMVNFSDSSTLTESDLDLMTAQLLYIEQEATDALDNAITIDLQGRMDAHGARVINVGNPVDAQDAVTKSYFDLNIGQYRDEAVAAAASASTDASSADADRAAAETARDTAVTAAAGMVNKADLNSPALTGTPTAPTAAAGTNTNQIATTAFVLANSLGAMYRTRVALAAATVPVTEKVVACLGYASPGDCDVFLLTRVATQPDYGGVRSADRFMPDGSTDATNGGWWVYVPTAAGVDARAFGYKADWTNGDAGTTDNAVALQNAINFAGDGFGTGVDSGGGCGTDVLLPKGTGVVGSPITVHDGVRLLGKGVFSTVIKMKDTFAGGSTFIRLGTPGNTYDICDTQTRGSAGDLVINGLIALGGVAKYLTLRNIRILCVANETARTFTVYGTNALGAAINASVAGATAGAYASLGTQFRTVTRVAVNGALAGNVAVGTQPMASFGARLENLQIFTTATNGATGTSMVYTDNAQHTAGLKNVKIFGGNRHCTRFEFGYGGASTFCFEDVETFNLGNTGPTNNSQMYFNYAGLLSPTRNLVVQGPGASGGSVAIGIEVVGGNVVIDGFHTEGVATGIRNNITSVNNGTLTVMNANGSPSCTNLIQIDSSAAASGTYVSRIFANGSTKTVDNKGTTVNGNILAWTTY